MKELDYKFYKELLSRSVSWRAIPNSVKKTLQFQNLLTSKTIDIEKAGRGSKVFIRNRITYESFFAAFFKEDETLPISKSSNIIKFRNSKARRTKSSSVYLIRGFKSVELNGKLLDLFNYTNLFGLMGVRQPVLNTESICFVENLESFLHAEKLLGDRFIYLHKYGRIGVGSLKGISASEIVVFVDYDFNGLDEYLRIKSVYDKATLLVPEKFDELFKNYSTEMKGKQRQSARVATSTLPEVVRIREVISKTNRFLEQEILTGSS